MMQSNTADMYVHVHVLLVFYSLLGTGINMLCLCMKITYIGTISRKNGKKRKKYIIAHTENSFIDVEKYSNPTA